MSARRLIIVGGVAGGASAAARARRLSEEAEITVFERGPHMSFANCGLSYCRLLAQRGFRVRNLSGSYRTWSTIQAAP